MTSIFDRYLFRQAAGALVLILLSLSGVVWIALALRQLNVVTGGAQDTLSFLLMTTLALPNLMVLIAPVALLVASVHVLTRLNGDSELIILTASGASMWTVARPLLMLAAIVSMAVALVNHVVMPWSLRELRQMTIKMRSDLIGQVIQPGRFSSPEYRLTFHIRDRAFNGDLLGLMVYDMRDPKQTMTYIAERGMVVKDAGESFLLMSKGHILRRDKPDDAPQIIAFDSYAVDLDRFEKAGSTPALKPRERYYDELTKPASDDKEFKEQPGHFRSELHERFSSPLYPLAFVMVALAFVGQAQSNRQNRWQGIAAAVVCGFASRMLGLGVNNLVVVNAKWVPLLYATPLLVMAGCALLIWWNAKPRPRSRIAAAASEAVAAAVVFMKGLNPLARLPALRKTKPRAS